VDEIMQELITLTGALTPYNTGQVEE